MARGIDRAARRAVESRRRRKVAQALQDAHSGFLLGTASNAGCRLDRARRLFLLRNSIKIPAGRSSIFQLL